MSARVNHSGVMLQGDYNKFYANTVIKTAQADVVLATGAEGPNRFSCGLFSFYSCFHSRFATVLPL